MYNNNFIDAFPEDEYIKLLNSPSLMSVMEEEYLNKYNSGSNTYFITIKESLDHYMAKKIDKDKNFVNSSEFEIYMNSLKNIYKKNTESFGLKKIYIEPSVNIIFNYLDKDTIGKYFSNFKISINNKSNDKLINNIFDKIDNSIELNDKDLSFKE